MNETNDTTRRPASGAKTLSLKKTETSTVKQSFSHGRTKAVVVEKKRTRAEPGVAPQKPQAPAPEAKAAAPAPQVAAPTTSPATREAQLRAGVVLRQLTDEEKVARSRALTDARADELEARKRAEEDARHRAVEDARLKIERTAAEKRKTEEDARKAADELARKHAEEEAARRLERPSEPVIAGEPSRRARVNVEEEEEGKKGAKTATKAPAAKLKPATDSRRRGKLTVTRRCRATMSARALSPPIAAICSASTRPSRCSPPGPPVRAKSSSPRPSRSPNSPTAWRAARSTSSKC